MTVAEYIFDYLQRKGVETVYMVSGSSSMWLTDALYRNKGLKAICCHHEQAAAMSADGYGRIFDVPGACLVTIGPGATNAITGVAQAYLDSSPMFVISGQANSRLLKYEIDTGIRQVGTQSLNLEPIVSSITKYFHAVMSPTEIPVVMDEAYGAAMQGRKGPVWIDVPVNIQNMEIPSDKLKREEVAENIICEVDMEQGIDNCCQTVINLLISAEKPLIMAGGGIRQADACSELIEFVEKYDIPVVTSRGGIDVISSDNKYFIGRPGAYGDRASHFAIQRCDLLIILGSRLSVSTIGYYPEQFGKNAKKIMIDIDCKELDRNSVPIDYKYCINLKKVLCRLNKSYNKRLMHTEWIRWCDDMKYKYPNVKQEYQNENPLNEYWVTSTISRCASPESNIVVDTGSVCNIVSQSWFIKKGQRYLISGGLSCMGFWATSIGTIEKGRSTIAITGDGSAQMNVQEFATLAYNKLPVKLFVYYNNGYMLIRHNQHNYMNDRFLGVGPDSGLKTPDFCEIAEAYGLKHVKIETNNELEEKVRWTINQEESVICEIMVQEFSPIIPRIASRVMPDGSLKAADFDDLYPFLN